MTSWGIGGWGLGFSVLIAANVFYIQGRGARVAGYRPFRARHPAGYYPHRQTDELTDVGLILRSPLSAGVIARELRNAVARINPSQPIAKVESLDTRLTESAS